MKALILAAALVIVGGGAALAHHSPLAVFAMEKKATQKGTFKSVRWTNPHVWFDVEVMKDGKPQTWSYESHGVTFFTRNGIRKRDFEAKAGLGVDVTSNPALNGGPTGHIRIMKFSDGTEFKMYNN